MLHSIYPLVQKAQEFTGQLLLTQMPMATDLLSRCTNDSPDSLIGHVIVSGDLTQ